jgi:GDP-L-fucose synthase
VFKDKNVLVTGGTGMIGKYLVELLLEKEAKVTIVSLDHPSRCPEGVEFVNADLTNFQACLSVCAKRDFIFHLAGVKGSPKMTKEKPASFFVPMMMFNTNMMEAARRSNVEWYLYTSSVGVYQPAPLLIEDDVWQTMPSQNDWFAGWAKRMGELQAESYSIEYGWDKVSIVRPANVYGKGDNFDPNNAMVIPSLIRRVLDGENPLTVWGDGSNIRDFIYGKDVAKGMLFAVENKITQPLNLASGKGVSIKDLVEIVIKGAGVYPEVVWDTSKPSGDRQRLMDMSRAKDLGFECEISLEEGIKETIEWYRENKSEVDKRYNVFTRN